MIEEKALVTAVKDQVVRINIQRSSACGHCAAGYGCGTRLFDSLFGNRQVEIDIENTIDAKVGDRVVIGIDESLMLHGSVLLYLLPLLGLIVGAMIFHSLFQLELITIIGGLLGTFACLAYVKGRPMLGEIKLLRHEHDGLRVSLG